MYLGKKVNTQLFTSKAIFTNRVRRYCLFWFEFSQNFVRFHRFGSTEKERRKLQVNTLRVNVAIYLGKKPGKYPDKYTVIPGKAFTGYLT